METHLSVIHLGFGGLLAVVVAGAERARAGLCGLCAWTACPCGVFGGEAAVVGVVL